jgi:translation initiation factor IF-1
MVAGVVAQVGDTVLVSMPDGFSRYGRVVRIAPGRARYGLRLRVGGRWQVEITDVSPSRVLEIVPYTVF